MIDSIMTVPFSKENHKKTCGLKKQQIFDLNKEEEKKLKAHHSSIKSQRDALSLSHMPTAVHWEVSPFSLFLSGQTSVPVM